MNKHIIGLAVSLMILFFSPAHAFTLTHDNDTYREGCDYKKFLVPPSTFPYTICMDACGVDPACQAWNFVPRPGNSTPLCFLKNCVGARRGAIGPVSGVKIPATMGFFETDIDRVGCDYTNFVGGTAQFCWLQCAFDSQCQAWNFDPRFTFMCFLKNCIPAPTLSVGLTGGVKFSQ